MIKSEQETKNLKLKRDLIFLILQFLNGEKYTESLHKLECESSCFFNMNYFEELIIDGNWDEMERYLLGFTKLDDNYSTKIFFELRKYKYLEALDRCDHVAATTILVNELKVFSAFNQDVFNDLTKPLTLDDFRENKQLASYINATDARSKMLVWFRDLIKANVVFHDRLNFPNLADSRLRNLINQSLKWQHMLCRNPSTNPEMKTPFVDHKCSQPSSSNVRSTTSNLANRSTSQLGGFLPVASNVMKQMVCSLDGRASPMLSKTDELPMTVTRTLNQGSRVVTMDFHPVLPTLLLDLGKVSCVAVNCIKWSPTGSLFGVVYSKCMLHMYSYHGENIQPHLEIEAHIGSVNDFASTSEQLSIVIGGDDKTIKVWDVVTGANLFTFEGHEAPVFCVCPHVRENFHAFFMWYKPQRGDPSVEWVEKRSIERINYKGLQKHSLGIVQFDITKDRFLAAGDDYVIKFWEMESEDLLATSDAGEDLPETLCICFNKEGTLLAASNGDQRSSEDVPKTIEVLKSTMTSKIKEISEPAQLQSLLLPGSVKMAKMLKLTYTSSNHAILALASNAIHLLWRWPHKSKTMAIFIHPRPVPTDVAFYPHDNNIIAIGMDDSTVKSMLKGHSKPITSLAFSFLSNLLVSAGADDQIIVWQCNKWMSKKSSFLQLPTGTATKKLSEIEVQFHQDQIHFLVVHELKLAVYETIKLECVVQWPVPKMSAPISHATFSCNSQLVYAAFLDGTVCIFCASNLRPRCLINSAAYLPSNTSHVIYPLVVATNSNEPNQFALGLTDGTVRVYELLESDGEWGEKSQCNDSTTLPAMGSSSKSTPACN
ncbi:Topless-related protein 2 [Camellia lanceoleosa]|uniref:Topless-related protein 2 n=1 Tax=Camellia lanceoleosa TaxID=1840588 RepID=A0ACC0FJN4_9ERIC|nr:Topless-related protein 2 [Camellia lanceoleosa]